MTKKRLLLIAAVVLIVLALKKASEQDRSEWQGLSESEARSKLAAKLPNRIPADKRTEISDKIVGKMRERGVIRETDGIVDLRDGATPDVEAAHR